MSELIQAPRQWLEKKNFGWQRLLLIASVLSLAPAISYLASPNYVTHVLMALLVLVGGFVAVRVFLLWPALGLVLVIPANMIVPVTIGTGTQTSVHATILLIALLSALWLWRMLEEQGEIRLVDSSSHRPLLWFLIVASVAFVVGQIPWFNATPAPIIAQLGGLGVFFISAAAFFLAGHQIAEMRWIRWMTWAFIALGSVYLAFRIIPGMFRYAGYVFQWGSVSSQFWNWFIALLFGQALLNRKLKISWRVALWLLLAAALYSVVYQTYDWKSGWIPPLVAIFTIIVLYRWQAGVALVAMGMVASPLLFSQLIASDEYSYATRVDAWVILLEIIKVNPIFGLGPANYYYYTPLYSIRGYNVRFNSHNQYIDIVAQLGIVGLVCLIWFFVEIGRLGWRLRTQVPEGFPQAYVYGVLGGFAGMVFSGMLGDWFLPFVYNVGVVGVRSSILGWLFLGTLVAMQQMVKRGAFPEDAGG